MLRKKALAPRPLWPTQSFPAAGVKSLYLLVGTTFLLLRMTQDYRGPLPLNKGSTQRRATGREDGVEAGASKSLRVCIFSVQSLMYTVNDFKTLVFLLRGNLFPLFLHSFSSQILSHFHSWVWQISACLYQCVANYLFSFCVNVWGHFPSFFVTDGRAFSTDFFLHIVITF